MERGETEKHNVSNFSYSDITKKKKIGEMCGGRKRERRKKGLSHTMH